MRVSLSRIFVFAIVLITGLIFFSNTAKAVGPYEPYLDYSASFDWNKTVSNELNIFNTGFSVVHYTDGTSASSGDLILGASMNIDSLYNTPTNNTHFDNGSGSGVSFQISDGTYTFLTATLTSMDVNLAGGGAVPTANSNLSFSDFNLTNITFGSGFSSRYIDELKSVVGTSGEMGLSATFSFNQGDSTFPAYDFKGTGWSGGTIQGIVSAPEPISSILFLSGGATLAFRRYRSRSKQAS